MSLHNRVTISAFHASVNRELAAYSYIYPFNSHLIGALAMPLEFRINHRCKTIASVSVTRSCGFDNLKNKMKRLARSRIRRLIHFNVM